MLSYTPGHLTTKNPIPNSIKGDRILSKKAVLKSYGRKIQLKDLGWVVRNINPIFFFANRTYNGRNQIKPSARI